MNEIPKALRSGYQRFRQNKFQREQELFSTLAAGQHPSIMMITCADSRIYASDLFDAHPGDIFIVRNVAGLVPPYRGVGEYRSTAASLEFAVLHLQVEHIVVLGHQNCGGIHACANQIENSNTHLGAWINQPQLIEERELHGDSHDLTALEQASVKRSVRDLLTYPFISNRVNSKKLELHGGWVSLPEVELYWLEEAGFVLVNGT